MSKNNELGKDYWKRYFDDLNRNKIEEKKKKTRMLKRTSQTPHEIMTTGIKNELLSYKKMLYDEQQKSDNLRGELYHISQENIHYKTKLSRIHQLLEN